MILQELLPTIYRDILPHELLTARVEKVDSTCNNCPMITEGKFKEHLKCCTFYPFVANYLVGSALVKGTPRGVIRVGGLINQKVFSLPLGLVAPPGYQKKFIEYGDGAFGNDASLLCPFYESGDCTIWQHRSSECIQHYCYSSFGEKGLEFWKKLGQFLFDVEMLLAQEAMLMKGYTIQEVERSLKYIKMDPSTLLPVWHLDNDEHKKLWEHFCDRSEHYFVECFLFVKKKGENLLLDRLNRGLLPSYKAALDAHREMLKVNA